MTFLPLTLIAQFREISGQVRDASNNQFISSATIRLHASGSTQSDGYGNFRLKMPEKIQPIEIIVSAIGYRSDTLVLKDNNGYYQISLMPLQELLSEVIVTGVSRATLARENPVAVVVVSKKSLDQAIENNIIDVLVKNVPGLSAVNTGPNVSKPFIRGLGYNRVLTLYDGVRQEGQQWGDEHGLEADIYNIEKGEVIKGPASLMFGSDATAGVVSIMSTMPREQDKKIHGRILSEYQSNNALLGNGFLLTRSSPHWAYALRGSFRIAKNYHNAVDGRVYNTGFRETNASGSIRYSKGSGHSDLNVSLYNNLQGIPDGSRDSLSRAFTKQIAEGSNDDVKNRPLLSGHDLTSYALSPLHQHIGHYRLFSNHHYAAGKGELDGMLAFQQNRRIEYNHPTQPSQPGMLVYLNTLNYSLRYNIDILRNTEFTAGFNGMHQQNKNKNATDFPIPDYTLSDAGAFVFTKWRNKKWTISGGARYDRRQLRGHDFFTRTNPSTGFTMQAFLPDTAGAYLQFPSFNTNFKGVSLSLGTTFLLSDKISVKANIGRGYRAPSMTEFASNGLDPGAHIIYLGNREFKPEFNLQADIGAEYRDNTINASVSLFNNNIHQYIYLAALTDNNGNSIVNAQGNKTYQYQQSAAQLYGMEATLGIHPQMIRGFSFNNAFSLIYGYSRSDDVRGKGLNGEYLPLMPPLKWLASVHQDFQLKSPVVKAVSVNIEFDVNASQQRYLALNETETFTTGYSLVNISLHSSIGYNKHHTLEFQVQANNIFDITYQSNLSRLKYFEYYGSSPSGRLGIFGMGRNICVKLIFNF